MGKGRHICSINIAVGNQTVKSSCNDADCHKVKHTRSVGSDLAPYYIPQKAVNHPPWPKDITLELLLASQAHLGHKTTHWNPANSRYIFGIRQGIHVISLDVTAAHLRRACRVVTGVTERGGLVLFAGTRPGQQRFVTQAAYMAGGYHVFERWVSGAITNRNQILGSCKLKVVDHLDREISGQEDILRQEPALKPDLVVCLNPLENWVLLHECALEGIPTIGVIDTDANPTWVTYPIPANDDSLRCIQVIAGALGRAGQLGKMRRQEAAEQGNIIHATVSLETKRAESLAPAGGKPDDGKGDDEEEEGPALPVDDDVNLTEPAEELDAFVQQAEFMARIEEKAQSD